MRHGCIIKIIVDKESQRHIGYIQNMSNKIRDLSQKLRSGIFLAQRTVEGRDFSLMLFNGGGVKTRVQ